MENTSETCLCSSIIPKEEIVFPNYVYIGHPITNLEKTLGPVEAKQALEFIENIGALVKRFGYTPILPATLGTNVKQASPTNKAQVYKNCALAVRISALFIAVPIIDSTGLGIEKQIAISNDIPILFVVADKIELTSMINHNHGTVIRYSDYSSCINKLHKHFTENSYRHNFSFFTFEKK